MSTDLIPTTLTEDNFDDELQASGELILVEFWASWCSPCQTLAATLHGLADGTDLAGRFRLAKIDIDESGDLVNRFGIQSVPTLMLFKQAKVVDQVIGAAPEDQLRQIIERHL